VFLCVKFGSHLVQGRIGPNEREDGCVSINHVTKPHEEVRAGIGDALPYALIPIVSVTAAKGDVMNRRGRKRQSKGLGRRAEAKKSHQKY
jgi:hypothetical protein